MGVLKSAQGVLNAAGAAANLINGLQPKEFYSVADFYNFIKKPDNVPTNHPLFTVVPHMSNSVDSSGVYFLSSVLIQYINHGYINFSITGS